LDADRIAVMQNGRVLDYVPYRDLPERCPACANLYNTQFHVALNGAMEN
jgi:ABC-type multidrug transport system fused ATPase/permease subunit